VYNLITKVIEEKIPFYAFEEIEKFRETLLRGGNDLAKITAKETQSPNYGAFLFRMINFFKCRTVLQIGCSTGVMTAYLASAGRTQTECFALENRSNVLQPAKDFALAHHLCKLCFIEGDYEKSLQSVANRLTKIDLLFVNQLPDSMEVENVIHLCKSLINESTILIINGIGANKKIKKTWKKIKEDPQVRVSMDLYALGIVFFNEKLQKRHYKVYFNHGKKQSLYKKRRRGLYFLSRRKKGSKNEFAH
jgi:predicted O-methyltransferase YrrM